jgi:hypothetical protein
VGLSKLGLDAGLVRYLPESKNKNGLYSTIVIVTVVLALVLTAVFNLGINIFSPALSFLREGWFLPVLWVYRSEFNIFCPEYSVHIDQAPGYEFDTEPADGSDDTDPVLFIEGWGLG